MTGPGEVPAAPEQLLSVQQVARLTGVAPAALRAWLRRGLLRPAAHQGRLQWFDFRAIGRARTLACFQRAGWSAARIERGLTFATRHVADADAALAGLAESLTLGRLAVRLPDGRVVEPSGQLLLDFTAGDGGGHGVAEPARSVRSLRSPQDWFASGVEYEAAGRLEEAVRAYERAVPGGDPEVLFNLGNCLLSLRRPEEARARFAEAVAAEPDYAEAWNNLGIAEGERGRAEAAIAAFRRAIAIVPHYADAHYNLAEALAVEGDLAEARRHFRAYLSYDPNSRWADQVRQRLLQLDGRRG